MAHWYIKRVLPIMHKNNGLKLPQFVNLTPDNQSKDAKKTWPYKTPFDISTRDKKAKGPCSRTAISSANQGPVYDYIWNALQVNNCITCKGHIQGYTEKGFMV